MNSWQDYWNFYTCNCGKRLRWGVEYCKSCLDKTTEEINKQEKIDDAKLHIQYNIDKECWD